MITMIRKHTFILTFFAVLCTLMITISYLLTEEDIIRAKKQEKLLLMNEIVDHHLYDNELVDSCFVVSNALLGRQVENKIYIGIKENIPTLALIETTANDGYNGDIRILVAIDWQNTLLGVRTLEHNETPGLGDKIDKIRSDWVDAFIGYMYTDDNDKRFDIKKYQGDFDQFTGASITPRAYIKAVHRTLIYFSEHKNELLLQAQCDGLN